MKTINTPNLNTSASSERLPPGPALEFIRAVARHMALRDHRRDIAAKSSIDFRSIVE